MTQMISQVQSWFCYKCGASNLHINAYCAMCATMNPVLQMRSQGAQTITIDNPPSRGLYIILALLFGSLGVHNFYAGRHTIGAIQVILWVVAIVTSLIYIGFLLWAVLIFWSVIEAICITDDGRGRRMR
jgi:TM2 domain-containing membrane protein YozV